MVYLPFPKISPRALAYDFGMKAKTWEQSMVDLEWAERFAATMRQLGASQTFEMLLEDGLTLWTTMGQMLPEDVAEFEYRWLPKHGQPFQPVSLGRQTLWGSTESLMADLDTLVA